MKRRRFVESMAALSAGGLLAACRGGGSASESVVGLTPPLSRVGIQLYTVRSLMGDDVPGTLDAVAAVGYDEVEFAGLFGHGPRQVRDWLDASGLAAPAAHIDPAELAPDRLDSTLESAATLGHGWLIQAYIPEEGRTLDGYRRTAEALNQAGARAAEAGVRIGYHNHAFEFEPLGETTGYDILLAELDPAYVDLEIDFHWSAVGGADPVALFRDHPGRFRLCHLKDLDDAGRMVDVGAGAIDWAGLFGHAETAGLVHYFVEHDQPSDPLASITASYRYLTAS